MGDGPVPTSREPRLTPLSEAGLATTSSMSHNILCSALLVNLRLLAYLLGEHLASFVDLRGVTDANAGWVVNAKRRNLYRLKRRDIETSIISLRD